MNNPRRKTPKFLFADLPEMQRESILSISQVSTPHLHDRMPTEENAIKAEVVEVGEMDTTGIAIGDLVHLEVETAGVAGRGAEKGIKITLVVLVCSEGWSRVSSCYRVHVTCFPLQSTVLLANRVVILDLH
jgi:hypothetical protein